MTHTIFSQHFKDMIWIFTALQVLAFVTGKLSTADISNCLLYGILACMCHSYCGGLVNVHVKTTISLVSVQAKIKWRIPAYCFILFSIHNLHQALSRWQTLQFKRCTKLDGFNSDSLTSIITTRWRSTNLSVPLTYDLWYLLMKPN